MTAPTVAEIAGKLTKARKALILALPDDGSWGVAPDRRVAVRLWWSGLGLIDHKHLPETNAEWSLGNRGLAVRAHLKENQP